MVPSVMEGAPQLGITSTDTSSAGVPPGLKLIPTDRLDRRTDEEIAAWLQTRHPVTSDKNVWAFWHNGYTNMPPWVQRNIINWVRRLGPDWTVHLLDRVDGSATNVSHYVDSSFFPECFNNNTMDGPTVGQHSGDLVRLPLLWLYGGIWIDAGSFLFRHVEDICWNKIEDPESPYEMAGFVIEMRPGVEVMLNGFIAAKRGNPFIKRWLEIFKKLWDGATNVQGFHKHPLLRHLPMLCPPIDKLNLPPQGLNVVMEQFTDYMSQIMSFERLRKLIDPSDGFNGPEYYSNKMFLCSALQETFYFQLVTEWSGTKQFNLLSTKRKGEGVVKDENWHAAENFVHDALANTATMKLSHGPPGALDSFLADLWDSAEHHGKDNEDGTFAAYLRYGSVHFDQTREMVPIKMGWPDEEVLEAGVLEPKK
ncbi:capsular polysaccharide synthesis protein-domain-containing protein [Annulohypoxylon truncatum]|uniref:capsular polysaccharide synthesis protein-domain-containing protein n=1 Tax=Annulohypoxylon truncatum TaxID=327061 RepID=UPI002007399D|nr:capsular polysaccharide synthesis protein-domain-containing protein [Annulohypoxylon truncatum]KAI1208568.1 capsular polysaccharide synthesis protein-domain-containing protein [Annulohypoxylon truncatum]